MKGQRRPTRRRQRMSEHTPKRGAEEDAVDADNEFVDAAELAAARDAEAGEVEAPETDDALVADAQDEAEATASPRERLDGIVESLLFAAGAPLPLRRLVDVLNGP